MKQMVEVEGLQLIMTPLYPLREFVLSVPAV